MKELAAYIGANSDDDGFCFCQFNISYTACEFIMLCVDREDIPCYITTGTLDARSKRGGES